MASLEDIQPERLNQQLPETPHGVVEWGFVLQTGQITFVRVNEFTYPNGYFLRTPVVLGARTDPGVELKADPEFKGVLMIESTDETALCAAEIVREIGDVWTATFFQATKRVGSANGTVGSNTPPQFIEAAVIALVRHAAAIEAA